MEFTSKPIKSENNTANGTLNFAFGGPARNAAETVAKITDEKVKLFSMVGDDALGSAMKSDLLKKRVNINFLETDPKLPTASKITVSVNSSLLREEENKTEDSDKKEKKKTADIVQFNGDILHKVAYKYLYPKLKDVNDSD